MIILNRDTLLPDFILSTRQNQVCDSLDMDSLDECLSKSFFKRYPYEVSYKFNSRGFRDEEWPETIQELRNSIWCFGDSFTVGLGCPYDSIWVKKLEKLTGIRTINISLDGASNTWIKRKVIRLIEEISPNFIVIHWSYFSRKEFPDETLIDEDRRLTLSKDDLKNNKHHKSLREDLLETLKYIKNIEDLKPRKVIHSIIRDEINFYPHHTKKTIHSSMENVCTHYIPLIEEIDYARDGFHYGVQTSELFANKIKSLLYKD